MIKRKDMNEPGDMFHQVIIDHVTDKYQEEIRAVVYPNYCDRVCLKINYSGLGFELPLDQVRNLIEVLEAALMACE
ncbi:hypothetical protein CPTAKMNP4_227 [Salmonella phage vB_SenM-AKM_NP4]|uniref:Uncharacterized protein n=1 Tax=Salmonella phage S16 TaxID=1087482 RepID=M1HNX3_BPS16|nr:hypothetical protein I133_gp043 [Salmonella phage vB_SenM-S16]AGE48207.1 hypothetical protein [Salmonella phage vB_SenM-S16]WDR21888.1 hypothetical protein PJM34_0220 [Salmonella phage vB_SenM_UTK0003]WLI71849.1 hypothetical protein CPTAKMNP4_227 [Salmonella phage vB_SenM-AKM_NP4]